MKKIISIALVCVLLIGLCACGSEPSLVGTTPVDDTPETVAPTTAGEKVFKVGDSVELNKVVVSFIGIETSTGSDFNTPEEGKVFLLCEFEIANNSSEELSVSSILCFEAYCDDYACEYSLGALMAAEGKAQLDGSVAAGKKMKGVVGYEVPADWKELEVQYTMDILSDDKIVFVATNN